MTVESLDIRGNQIKFQIWKKVENRMKIECNYIPVLSPPRIRDIYATYYPTIKTRGGRMQFCDLSAAVTKRSIGSVFPEMIYNVFSTLI